MTCIQFLSCVTFARMSTKYKYKVMRGLFWATSWVTPEPVLEVVRALGFTSMKVLQLALTLVRQ